MNILVIEDDEQLIFQISRVFKKYSFVNRITRLKSYDEFINRSIELSSYDIILLDIIL